MILNFGDTGSLVEALQLALIRSGYLSGAPDGIFGEKTREALFRFQTSYGLTADGIAGEKTFAQLERYLRGYYKKEVRKGDTLWNIASDNGISIKQLLTANPGIDADNLSVGNTLTVPYSFDVVPTDISYSYYLTKLIIEGLKARYPFIKTSVTGYSETGKTIDDITIGNGKNEIFINSGFHANEWLNIPVVLKFTEEFLYSLINEKAIENIRPSEIINEVTIKTIPLVNPDGLDLVTGALNEGAIFEKAKKIADDYPFVPFPSGWKANINGVDLNLQFPAMWEKAKEIKFKQGFISPSPIEFVGTAPLTEKEARIIYEYTLNNNFRLILAYHSQGSIIYWKYTDFLPPDSLRIGEELSAASGYPLSITPPDSSYAGYKDWFIENYNRPGYTIETGIGTNPLPVSQFDTIYSENRRLISAALKETSLLQNSD